MGIKLEKWVRPSTFVPVVIDSRSIVMVQQHAIQGVHITVGFESIWVKGAIDEIMKLIDEDLKDYGGYKITHVVNNDGLKTLVINDGLNKLPQAQ
jgi:hypothetical protein